MRDGKRREPVHCQKRPFEFSAKVSRRRVRLVQFPESRRYHRALRASQCQVRQQRTHQNVIQSLDEMKRPERRFVQCARRFFRRFFAKPRRVSPAAAHDDDDTNTALYFFDVVVVVVVLLLLLLRSLAAGKKWAFSIGKPEE